MSAVLTALRHSLEQASGIGVPECVFKPNTPFAMQFTCDEVEVDLLPCPFITSLRHQGRSS